MRFLAVQFDIAWEDKPRNHRHIEDLLESAAPPPGSFVVLPELGDTGFSFDLDRIVDDHSLTWASQLARQRGLWLQVGYAVRGPEGMGRNCASLIDPHGQLVGTYQKVHPFSYGREAEFFRGGQSILLRRCGQTVVSPLICYDLRFPELWRHAAIWGAEVITIGASWPAARQSHWRALLIARAIENQMYVVAVNRIGEDPHLAYAGGSLVISPKGDVLAEAAQQTAILQVDIDLEALRSWRAQFPALSDIHKDLLGTISVDGPIEQPSKPA